MGKKDHAEIDYNDARSEVREMIEEMSENFDQMPWEASGQIEIQIQKATGGKPALQSGEKQIVSDSRHKILAIL